MHRPAHDPQLRSCCLIFTAKVEKFKLSENSGIFCSILNKIIATSPFQFKSRSEFLSMKTVQVVFNFETGDLICLYSFHWRIFVFPWINNCLIYFSFSSKYLPHSLSPFLVLLSVSKLQNLYKTLLSSIFYVGKLVRSSIALKNNFFKKFNPSWALYSPSLSCLFVL